VERRFVFVDESGDLGFEECASKYFTICAVITTDPRQLERIPQRVRRRRLKTNLKRKSELKFHDSDALVKEDVLHRVAALDDVSIMGVSARKAKAFHRPGTSADRTYMQLLEVLVQDVIWAERRTRTFTFILDNRPLERAIARVFDGFLQSEIIRECDELKIIPPEIRISRYDSLNSRGLQVADFVAGAIRRKHERGDSTCYDIISEKVTCERVIRIR
jgi:hypothetical protein